ncbi:phiSA1p31-related protein [Streptomyces sp. NPDC006610]|uniref:phiSA1p31-related protein n=1 Tax=Streptomyces sp. NPDC006610 TaxID=3154584 RepID=UPI0033B46666
MDVLIDGARIDLDRTQVAVDNSRWLWTCDVSDAGDPLMQRVDGPIPAVLPLHAVILTHGVLVPERQAPTPALYREVLEAA